jgi:hypothetical protein
MRLQMSCNYGCNYVRLVANSGRHGQEWPSLAWLKSWLAHHGRCWSLWLLHFTAAPRTPNPLIIGPICSTLLVAVRNCPLTWAFAVRSWFVVAVRSLTLPVESRPVSRPESPSCCVARSARVDGYASSGSITAPGSSGWVHVERLRHLHVQISVSLSDLRASGLNHTDRLGGGGESCLAGRGTSSVRACSAGGWANERNHA